MSRPRLLDLFCGSAVPPAGFEPALPANPHDDSDPAVTDSGSLPAVLHAKLDGLREGAKA